MATTPHATIDQADAAFNRGFIDAVLSYYEENAVWVVKPGHIVRGKPQLRREFEEILRINPKVSKVNEHVIECGDIALCSIKWRLVGMTVDGTPVSMEGVASTVLRKQSDGRWQIVIDNPWVPDLIAVEDSDLW